MSAVIHQFPNRPASNTAGRQASELARQQKLSELKRLLEPQNASGRGWIRLSASDRELVATRLHRLLIDARSERMSMTKIVRNSKLNSSAVKSEKLALLRLDPSLSGEAKNKAASRLSQRAAHYANVAVAIQRLKGLQDPESILLQLFEDTALMTLTPPSESDPVVTLTRSVERIVNDVIKHQSVGNLLRRIWRTPSRWDCCNNRFSPSAYFPSGWLFLSELWETVEETSPLPLVHLFEFPVGRPEIEVTITQNGVASRRQISAKIVKEVWLGAGPTVSPDVFGPLLQFRPALRLDEFELHNPYVSVEYPPNEPILARTREGEPVCILLHPFDAPVPQNDGSPIQFWEDKAMYWEEKAILAEPHEEATYYFVYLPLTTAALKLIERLAEIYDSLPNDTHPVTKLVEYHWDNNHHRRFHRSHALFWLEEAVNSGALGSALVCASRELHDSFDLFETERARALADQDAKMMSRLAALQTI